MRDQYTRLVRAGQPYDFQDTAYDYMGFNTVNNIELPDSSETLGGELKQQTVNKSDVDFLKLSSAIQDVFFDLYGTNLPKDKLDEVISELPSMIPNQIEVFELTLVKTLRNMKVFDWVDTQVEDEFTDPEQLQTEIDGLVDSGDTGDLDKNMLDGALDEEDPINDFDGDEDDEDEPLTPKVSAKERAIIERTIDVEIRQMEASRVQEEVRRMGGEDGRRPQKRSVGDASEQYRHIYNQCADRKLKSNQTEKIISKRIQADMQELGGFDIGLGKGQIRRATGKGGGGGSVDGGWFGLIQQGSVQSSNPLGLPTIDCDKIGGV